MPEVAPLAAFIVAIVGAAGGFFFRGRISGTDANKLWDVSEKLRIEAREEVRGLRGENRDMEKRIAELEKRASVAETLADQLTRQGQWKDDLIARQQAEIAALRTR